MKKVNQTLLESSLASKTYVVGGAVRDMNLNLEIEDMDYVITVSEEEFSRVFPNSVMVGNSFPVYLIEGDEVALSRTEKNSGHGYGNFELTGLGVPIQDDLNRRDFTINAIAMNIVSSEIIDPFGGLDDLKSGLIRTTYKDSFKDDPVRILRAFRFGARYDFSMSPETEEQILMFRDELQYVTKERIVLELTKVWKQVKKPSRYFKELLKYGVIDFILPEFSKLNLVPGGPSEFHGELSAFDHTMEVIDRVKESEGTFHQFIAALFHDIGKAFTDKDVLPHHYGHEKKSLEFAEEFFKDHRFSKRVNEFVPKFARLHMRAHLVQEMNAKKLAKFILKIGRKDFDDMVLVFDADHKMSIGMKKTFDFMREVLYNTDLSVLAEIPSSQRAQKAHQIRVDRFKQFKKENKEISNAERN